MTAFGQTTQLFSTPYLTAAEFKNAPTDVDYDRLVGGGTTQQNAAELLNLIARASSQIDAYCHQTLSATLDTWQTRARIGRDGMLRLHTRYFPIRSVTALSFGLSPDAMNAVTLDSTVWVEQRRIIVPATLVLPATSTATLSRPSVYGRTAIAQVSYVAGYPNTTLTADVAAASSLPLADATGILPGDTLGVYDETDGIQTVTVAATWTPATGAASVPTTTAVTATSGTSVSGLPPAIKQAAIHVVTGLLKSRGAGSLILRPGSNEPGGTAKSGGADWHFNAARDLLTEFARVA